MAQDHDNGTKRSPVLDQLTCVRCGYSLAGSAPDGRCPECGTDAADTLRVYARPDHLASGFRALRWSYACSYVLLFAVAPVIGAAVSIASALLCLVGTWKVFVAARQYGIKTLRRYCHVLGAVALLQAVIPAALAVKEMPPLVVPYAAAVLVLFSAYTASGLAIRIARPIAYERIIHQLRSQRLLIRLAAASVLVIAATAFGFEVTALALLHVAIAALLGVIAIGHTLVALSDLSKVISSDSPEARTLAQALDDATFP